MKQWWHTLRRYPWTRVYIIAMLAAILALQVYETLR